jgi:hypothetical protein
MNETDEIYSITLTTSNQNSDKNNNPIFRTAGNYSDVSWNINYDALFNGRNKLFKYCRVRFNLQGAAGNYTFNNQNGYLCANFQTNFNSQNTLLPCILGLIYAKTNPNTQDTDLNVYSISTLNDIGVDILPSQLEGIKILNIKMVNDDSLTQISNITKDWEIFLTFQLYN